MLSHVYSCNFLKFSIKYLVALNTPKVLHIATNKLMQLVKCTFNYKRASTYKPRALRPLPWTALGHTRMDDAS